MMANLKKCSVSFRIPILYVTRQCLDGFRLWPEFGAWFDAFWGQNLGSCRMPFQHCRRLRVWNFVCVRSSLLWLMHWVGTTWNYCKWEMKGRSNQPTTSIHPAVARGHSLRWASSKGKALMLQVSHGGPWWANQFRFCFPSATRQVQIRVHRASSGEPFGCTHSRWQLQCWKGSKKFHWRYLGMTPL